MFTEVEIGTLPKLRFSSIVLAQLNPGTDNNLDIIVSGSAKSGVITKVYKNQNAPVNIVPTAPTALTLITNQGYWQVSWPAASDGITPTSLIRYQLNYSSNSSLLYTNNISFPRGQANLGNVPSGTLYNTKLPAGYPIYAKVRSIDSSFSFSDSIYGSVSAPAPNPPVWGFPQQPSSTSNSVKLKWTDHNCELSYTLLRNTTASTSGMIGVQTINRDVTSCSDSLGTQPDTRYSYTLKANNKSGSSGYSAILSCVTWPRMPSWVSKSSPSTNSAVLKWTDAHTETNYILYRSTTTNFISPTRIVVPANQTNYTNQALSPGTDYYYKVKATNIAGGSSLSPRIHVQTKFAPPVWRKGNPVPAGSFSMIWSRIPNAASYTLFKNTTNYFPGAARLTNVLAPLTNYTDPAGSLTNFYYYWIKCANPSNRSTNSISLIRFPQCSGFSSSPAAEDKAVLSWNVLPNISSYTLYRNNTNNPLTSQKMGGTLSSVTNITNAGLSASSIYYFWVRGFNANSSSYYSSARVRMPQPQWVRAQPVSLSTFNLVWQPLPHLSSYTLYRAVTNDIAQALARTNFSAGVTNFLDTQLVSSNAYYYWLRGFTNNGSSWYSAGAIRHPAFTPALASNFSFSSVSSNSMVFSWECGTNAAGFVLLVSESSSTNFASRRVLPKGSSSAVLNNLATCAKYFFWIKSTNFFGSRGFSSAVSNWTLAGTPDLAPDQLLNKVTIISQFFFTNRMTKGTYRYKWTKSVPSVVSNSDTLWDTAASNFIDMNAVGEGFWYLNILSYNSNNTASYQRTLGPCIYYSELVGPFGLKTVKLRVDPGNSDFALVQNSGRISNTITQLDISDGRVFLIDVIEGIANIEADGVTNSIPFARSLSGNISFKVKGNVINSVTVRVWWQADPLVYADISSIKISPVMSLKDDNDAVIYKNIIDPKDGDLIIYINADEGDIVELRFYDVMSKKLVRSLKEKGSKLKCVRYDLRNDKGALLPDNFYGIIVETPKFRKEMKFMVKRK